MVVYAIIIGNIKVTGAFTGWSGVSREHNNSFTLNGASPMHIKHIVIVIELMLKYKNVQNN